MYIDKSDLAPKLARLKTAVPPSKIENFAKGVLFRSNEIIAANESMTVITKIGVDADSSFIMPPRAVDMIESLPDGSILIHDCGEGKMLLEAGTIKNRFATVPVDEYPETDKMSEQCENITIAAGDLLDAISSVMYVVPNDSPKPQHCGVLFDAANGYLNLVSCDGYRCAWNKLPYDKEFKFIIPKVAAKCLLSLGITGDVEIMFDRKQALFKSSEYTVISRLLTGEFLDYTQVFPQSCKANVEIDRGLLLDALRRANICIDQKSKRAVLLDFQEDVCAISVSGGDAQYSEDIPLEGDNSKPLKIAFNTTYLQDAIKNVVSDKISIKMTSSASPALLEDGDFKALVLPIRLESVVGG